MNSQPAGKVGVIILNWNGWRDTLRCIDILHQAETPSNPFDIIVVDNGSTDESIPKLHQRSDFKLFELGENKGFSAANNVGIRYALGQGCGHILLLNNDAFVSPDFLKPLLERLSTDARAGIVNPKMYYDQSGADFSVDSRQENRTIWCVGGKFRQPRLLGELIGMDEIDQGQHDLPQTVDFAVGCCMLIKRSVFEEIGLLDERFFFYQEDIDFSYRATKAGFTVWYEPNSQIWHQVSRSTQDNLPHRTFLNSMSRVVFFAKHIRGARWVPVFGLEFIRLFRTILTRLVSGQPRQASSYVRGIVAGWTYVLKRSLTDANQEECR